MDLARVERALDQLEAQGARSFDAASCDCVRTIITRAEALGGPAEQLLAVRANVHVERLAARFERARGETAQLIDRFERTHEPVPFAKDALRVGDVVRARRIVRRLLRQPRAPIHSAHVADKHEAVRAYDDSVAELVAAFALARAVDVVPEHAGPYNPLRIASELLTRMRTVSPLYLTVQLNRLEELASLLELPELPGDGAKTLPSRKKRALKKGS